MSKSENLVSLNISEIKILVDLLNEKSFEVNPESSKFMQMLAIESKLSDYLEDERNVANRDGVISVIIRNETNGCGDFCCGLN